MPSILLINDNKIVSRLLQLSSKKHNYDLEEISDYNPSGSAYNVVFVDSHKYNSSSLKNLMGAITYDKLGFIGSKNGDIPSEFDIAIEKPFLPTDFVSLIDENFKVVDSFEEEETKEEELKLDELEELSPLDEKIEEIPELEEDKPLDELEIPQTTLSTGIANTISGEDEKIELSDMVSEIDNMSDEEPIEDLSLEDLKIDDSIDDIEVKSESVLEEIEDEIDASLDSITQEEESKESLETPDELIDLDKKEELVEEEIKESPTPKEEEKEEPSAVENIVAAASVAGAGAVVADALSNDKVDDIDSAIDELDGIEDIEKESDYLADEFDDLDEEEIVQALEEESEILEDISTPKEEIISEEISTEGEERVVEPTDLEEMIQKAVADSITPELLQKALEGMDINVSLSFSPKNEEADS
jgi:uncharacterized membrane protein